MQEVENWRPQNDRIIIRLPAFPTHQRREHSLLRGNDFHRDRRPLRRICSTRKCCATPPRPSFIISRPNSNAKPSPSANLPARWKKPCEDWPDLPPANSKHARRKSSKPTSACSPASPPTAWNFFSSAITNELRQQLRNVPRVLRFRGLRGCVKQLAGAQRWSSRCEKMQEQIVEYLRGCLTAEPEQNECALVVE